MMKNVIHINSLDIPELQPYRTMRRAVEHVRQGIFVAESEKVVKRLLNTNLEIVSILITENRFDEIGHLIDAREQRDFNIYIGEKELLEQIVGFDLHQGVMAVAKIPEPLVIEDVVKQSLQPYLFVALDGLTNADNLGVIVRNCVAFGVTGLIVGETSSSPYLRRAIRQSMGAVFVLPIIHTKNLRETLIMLEEKFNTRCLAADAHANDISIQDADLKRNICIVLGSEGSGIRESVLEVCSERITIPVSEYVDSLNVASASAVFLWEVRRRRKPTTSR